MSARWMSSVFTAGMSSPLSTMLVDSRMSYLPSPNSVMTRSSSVGASRPCACAVRASGTISRKPVGHAAEILDARHDAEHLAAAEAFALHRLADHHRVERHDEGAHRQAIDRRRGDQAHFAHAGQRQLQGARDRRRGQRQHVHVGLQRLQLFLVGDAEMLLLVDDQQAEIGKVGALGQQRVGADDDVDVAVGEPAPYLGRLLRRHHARQLGDLDGKPREPGRERAEMLAGQQGGRHHHGDLAAGHGGDEGGAERHLGLAEADIAADQPVHRPAGGEILQHVGDGARLVVGFGVGEAGAEFVPGAFRRRHDLGVAQAALGGDADQLAGHVADALLGLRLAVLPEVPPELVERDAAALAAEA